MNFWAGREALSVPPRQCSMTVKVSFPMLLWVLCDVALASPEKSFLASLHTLKSFTGMQPTQIEAESYFAANVETVVQNQCVVCHRSGGTAPSNGARLIFTDSAERNEAALRYMALTEESASYVLSKVSGDLSHGGGSVLSPGSSDYVVLARYLSLLEGADGGDTAASSQFWNGIALESRETTLRRASIILAGRIPKAPAIARATESDANLRKELLDLMTGDGFHDFLITAAGDQLLTAGVLNGVDFPYEYTARYPAWSEARAALGTSYPDGYDTSERAFLHRNAASIEFAWAVAQEPLELIAYIVMNDKPYTEILTADYTMVNILSDIAYRSGAGFEKPLVDSQGTYHPPDFGRFLPGINRGHVPIDEAWSFDQENQVVTSFSDYHAMPHAGVLTTPGWLGRYPSTETNRNRARARWTYFHFLGVDIEKSAKRSTDPDALADLNNPTMNNGACTVCHERLDPVAGAYQLFGDSGHYLDRGNGAHALPDTYTCYDCSDFQPGDTWFRDMRPPGFEGELAGDGSSSDSLQWLARQIITDERFPEATAKFWWPAIFGAPALLPPDSTEAPNYDELISAYNAQQELIKEFSDNFVKSGFNAKELLADMIMSAWYRASDFEEETGDGRRGVQLATVGSGRLLTPEELDRKNRAVFGRSWRQWLDGFGSESNRFKSALRFSTRGSFNIFLGGINGANVTKRNRQMTPLMSGVAQIMALDLSCQIVLEEFEKPANQRNALGLVEATTDFTTATGEEDIRRQVSELLLRAYNRPASERQITLLMQDMRDYASAETRKGSRFDASGSCDLNEIWGEVLEDDRLERALYDPAGMKRAWSMVVHSVLNSFWYLHD
jgi:hypothetical protein